MNKLNIKPEDLKALGIPEKAIGITMGILDEKFNNRKRSVVLARIAEVVRTPQEYSDDRSFGELARLLTSK